MMKIRKKIYLLLTFIVPLAFLFGCNKSELPDSAYPDNDNNEGHNEYQTTAYDIDVLPNSITEEIDVNGIHVIFDADVDCGTWEDVSQIFMQYDAEKYDALCEWLPEGIINNDNGFISYFNPESDLNGSGEDDHFGENGYITSMIPVGMSESSQVVGERAARLLSEYSDFDFYLDNSRAQSDESSDKGYYYMCFGAAIDGIFISSYNRNDYKLNIMISGISVSVMESEEGIFCLNGRIPFRVSDKTPVFPNQNFDSYIEKFKEDIVNIASSQSVMVKEIRLVYLPEYNNDGSIVLTPVILFECLEPDISIHEMIAYSYKSADFICILY